jgi:hypothetical protein
MEQIYSVFHHTAEDIGDRESGPMIQPCLDFIDDFADINEAKEFILERLCPETYVIIDNEKEWQYDAETKTWRVTYDQPNIGSMPVM